MVRKSLPLVLLGFCAACGNAPSGIGKAGHCERTVIASEFIDAAEVQRADSGQLRLLRGENLSREVLCWEEYRNAAGRHQYSEMAILFIEFYRGPFGLASPREELEATKSQEDDLGYHQVRLAQRIDGLPVLGSEILVQFSPPGAIDFVSGFYVPTPVNFSLRPTLEADYVRNEILKQEPTDATVTDGTLAIFLPSRGSPALVYQFDVHRSSTDRARLLVDANNGEKTQEIPIIYSK